MIEGLARCTLLWVGAESGGVKDGGVKCGVEDIETDIFARGRLCASLYIEHVHGRPTKFAVGELNLFSVHCQLQITLWLC